MSAHQTAINNRKQLGWSPTTLLLGIMVTTILGTAGVVAGPIRGYQSALAREASLEQAEGALIRLRTQKVEAKQALDHAQLSQLSELLHSYIPSEPDRISLYAEVRSAAELSGVRLKTVAFASADALLGPGGSDEWVHMAKLNTSGDAQPAAIERLLRLLRLSGQPTLVTAFSLQRSHLDQPDFRFNLQLGFPYYGPAPPVTEVNLGMNPTR